MPINPNAIALCVPAYQAERFLPRLLGSAAAQTRPFAEILIYDDCSKDRTSEVARELGATVIRGERNVGCSAGKNVLMAAATAPWLHFHDADDELLPKFVERAECWIDAVPELDVVLFAYEVKDEDTGSFQLRRSFDADRIRQDSIGYAIEEQINPFCGLYRREAILRAGGYDTDPAVLYNEDCAFHIRLARAGLRFDADPNVSVINYVRGTSMSAANRAKCIAARIAVMEKNAIDIDVRHHAALSRATWRAVGVAAHEGDWEAAYRGVALVQRLTGRVPPLGRPVFRALCAVHPKSAVRFREYLLQALETVGLSPRRSA